MAIGKRISGRGGKKIPGTGLNTGLKNGRVSSRMKLKSKIKDLLRSGSFMKLGKKG